jgi:hypothetical protein
VAQLRELDLQLALTRPRMAREYVKDEHRAVCDGEPIQHLFQCRALAGTERVERDNEVRILCARDLRNFLDLALTEQSGRVHAGTPLHRSRNDDRTRRARQRIEFVHFDLEKSAIFSGVDAG